MDVGVGDLLWAKVIGYPRYPSKVRAQCCNLTSPYSQCCNLTSPYCVTNAGIVGSRRQCSCGISNAKEGVSGRGLVLFYGDTGWPAADLSTHT